MNVIKAAGVLAAGATIVAAAAYVASGPAAADPPSGYSHFTSDARLWQDGGNVVIQANAIPNHKSPYFQTTDPRWEAYNGTNPNWAQNPNHIGTQTIEFRIPANPQAAPTHAATPLGPIGVAINGVPIFNQYAGPNQPLTNEINSFDQYDGHPQQTSMYHYHVEPYALTAANGRDSLIGYLLDGFPVYGPSENGVDVTNGNLDQYHGHTHATADYPGGIYHYHVTAAAPYINGNGFYGTAGTVTYSFSATPTATGTTAVTSTFIATATATATATPTPTPCAGDTDCDGIDDAFDNCVAVPNPAQDNSDSDALGDACDGDDDDDTVADTSDNCQYGVNPDQAHSDPDLILLSPDKAFNDLTWSNSDASGDACDTDDDNDGRSDADELAGAGGCAATEPLLRDTDGDRILDSAECALGTNPNVTNAAPPACSAAADADADFVLDSREFCYYGTLPSNANTDGDTCSDAKEVASVNADLAVNAIDLSQVAQAFGAYAFGAPAYKYDFDVTKDGNINATDLSQVAQRFGPC